MRTFSVFLIMALLLAACSSQGGPAATDTPVPAATETPVQPVATATVEVAAGETATPEVVTVEVPADGAIVLRREGGIAGIQEQWTVYQDGRVVDLEGNEFQVPTELVDSLTVTAESAGFFELPDSFIPENPCCDRFTIWLGVRRGENVHVVTAVEGTEEVPPAFWQLVDTVQVALDAVVGP